MAEFSGNIIDVYYFDQEKTVINVEWRGEDDKIRRFFVTVDDADHNYQDLITEGWTEEKIEQSTRDFRKRARKAFEKECLLIAEREGIIDSSDFTFSKVYEFLNQKEDQIDSEKLFKFKIEAFDTQAVVESDDVEIKRAIRKATSFKEVVDLVYNLQNANTPEDEVVVAPEDGTESV